jgi:hypothetical protein
MPIVTDPIENPQGFARENIVDALLCLADPAQKAQHVHAAWLIAECVTLASIAAGRELVDLHEAKHHD